MKRDLRKSEFHNLTSSIVNAGQPRKPYSPQRWGYGLRLRLYRLLLLRLLLGLFSGSAVLPSALGSRPTSTALSSPASAPSAGSSSGSAVLPSALGLRSTSTVLSPSSGLWPGIQAAQEVGQEDPEEAKDKAAAQEKARQTENKLRQRAKKRADIADKRQGRRTGSGVKKRKWRSRGRAQRRNRTFRILGAGRRRARSTTQRWRVAAGLGWAMCASLRQSAGGTRPLRLSFSRAPTPATASLARPAQLLLYFRIVGIRGARPVVV